LTFTGVDPCGSISMTLLPKMVSVRIASRLSVPMVLLPVENATKMWSPSIASFWTLPTSIPLMRTLSPVFSPPVSLN
jgi:hypothetical protein